MDRRQFLSSSVLATFTSLIHFDAQAVPTVHEIVVELNALAWFKSGVFSDTEVKVVDSLLYQLGARIPEMRAAKVQAMTEVFPTGPRGAVRMWVIQAANRLGLLDEASTDRLIHHAC